MPTPPPHTLTTLSPPLLDRVLKLALDADPALAATFISSLSSSVHDSLVRIKTASIALPDDDAILVQAENDNEREGGRRSSLVSAVWGVPHFASLVRDLVVVRPVVAGAALEGENGANGGDSHTQDEEDQPSFDDFTAPTSTPIPPLEDSAFFLFLSKLNNLTSFSWKSYRLPPEQLCPALGAAAPHLKQFELDLLPSPFDGAAAEVAPGSPSLSSTAGAGHHAHHHHHVRWDAPNLASLPAGVTSLSLSSLSQAGCKSLGAALPAFIALESLEVAKTLFVDDQVMGDIGQGAARSLRRLRIAEMGGTKLSEVGLGEVLRGCEGLEVLELDAVEGRLSRTCWSKLSPLPSSLQTLKLTYSESGPHKSWTLDHLSSLPALLTSSSLTHLSLTRRVPHPAALLPGSHQLARYPVDPVLQPRTLGKKELEALGERGDAWESLELDLFKVDMDGVKKILDNCSGLKRLKVMLDDPFRNVLNLTASFACVPLLRHFLVAIPPEHVPETASITPASYRSALEQLDSAHAPASPVGSPSMGKSSPPLPDSPDPPRRSPSSGKSLALHGADKASASSTSASASSEKSPSGLHLSGIDALLPPTRDWRRFLKKAHALEAVTWTGRGGVGTWSFSKPGGSSLVKVAFAPTRPSPGAYEDVRGEAAEGEEEGMKYAAMQSQANRPRRRSSVSLAGSCLSGLSLSPSTMATTSPSFQPFDSPVSPSSAGGGATLFTPGTSYTSLSFSAAGGGAKGAPLASPPLEGGWGGTGSGHRRRSTTGGSSGSFSSSSGGGAGAGGSAGYGFPHTGGALGLGIPAPSSSAGMAFGTIPAPPPGAVGWASSPLEEEEDGATSAAVMKKKVAGGKPPSPTASKNAASASGSASKTFASIASSSPPPAGANAGGGGGRRASTTSSSSGGGWASPPSPTRERKTGGGRKDSKEGSPTTGRKERGRTGAGAGGGGGGKKK
ncbi:hypothetical protein JCM6882_005441 [Rhodosporidiobolus microsporus]